jgi:hypothetical protein
MAWEIEFDDAFETEFAAFAEDVQDALLAVAKLLADYGPHLGRPHADTLKGSKRANMKELRFEASDGEWRAAFGPSILDARRSCLSPVISPVEVRNDSTGSSSSRRIDAFLPI